MSKSRRISNFKLFWNTHKWVGIISAIFILNLAITGFMLLIKKNVAWIQPPEIRGAEPNQFGMSFDDIVEACRQHPELAIQSWEDIDRLDVRPGKGMLKVRANNNWEAQIDITDGRVLKVAYRRSDIIESIHDGSFYADWLHAWVWPAVACCLVFLAFSGFWLWLEPKVRRARRRRAQAMKA
jgi:uncharacterized iron-regulated membrane protein